MRLARKFGYAFATRVGFLGLGNMGLPMAINLKKNGFDVQAFDIDHKKKSELAKHSITFVDQVKDLARNNDHFVLMLPNSEHSQQTCTSDNGLFKNAKKNSLIIDCSTISPIVAKELNAAGKKVGMNYVDAPVSGGVAGAEASTLTFMVGAETPQVFNQAKPILQGMGKSVFNCEKPGAGQIAKICNNMALAIQMVSVAEALALGKKLGIDDKILTNIMKVSSSRCWSLDASNPVPGVMENVPASRNYERGFGCELMLKDLKIAEDCAKQINADITFGRLSKDIYQKLTDEGKGRKDFGIVFENLFKSGFK